MLYDQFPLVPEKMRPPPMLATWVPRRRLSSRLAAADTRLILVAAPAGFGKSTLVVQWLHFAQSGNTVAISARSHDGAANGRGAAAPAVAWLSLDEHDQDELQFLAYVAGAIELAAPGALATTEALLTAGAIPPFVIVQALLADVSAVPGGLTLVLDDYHAIAAKAVHKIVTYLLRHWPRGCRLIIISRVEPPLLLSRLRAEQQLTELGADELRFTEAETGQLLANQYGSRPDTALVTGLHQQMEGWALALQLAAIARLESNDPELAERTTTRRIIAYLADEVLAQQDKALRRVMLALAVPERFCAGLCAALLGTPDEVEQAAELLEQLMEANLFLTLLDGAGNWYRFHPLFRELLLRRLKLEAGETGLRVLYHRAARWLAAAGVVEQAARQYLAAGDHAAAADLVEGRLLSEWNTGVAGARSISWLRLLPEQLVERRPGLALLQTRIALHTVNLTAAAVNLAKVDALLASPDVAGSAPPWPTFHADLATMRGMLHYYEHRPEDAVAVLEAALEQPIGLDLAGQALLILGRSYVAAGRYSQAVLQIAGRRGAPGSGWSQVSEISRAVALSVMHGLAGNLGAQVQDAGPAAYVAIAESANHLWAGYVAAGLGRTAYERFDLATAARYFQMLAGHKYQVTYPSYMFGLVGLVLVAVAQGAFAKADELVQVALDFAREAGGAFLRHQAYACAAVVALKRGDMPAALAAAEAIGVDMHLGLTAAMEAPRLVQVRALIAAGDAARLARADRLLADCLAEIERFHNTRLQIRALALTALLRHAQRQPAEAVAALERAVALAAPLGYVRTFVDLGPALHTLLEEHGVSAATRHYLRTVAAAGAPSAAPAAPAPPLGPPSGLPEPLTRREREILVLLAERWSDKEIAEQLVIAPSTVRRHTTTIYGKLGVSRRREAVALAQATGILPAHTSQ